MLHPQARALLDLMIERNVPPVHTLPPDEARRLYRERRFFTQPAPPPVADVSELRAGTIPLRMYRPLGSSADARLPVLAYFHGGGWVIGDLDTHDSLCRQLANEAGVAVASVDYRLAPEHRYPAAVDDCLGAVAWLRREADALKLDATRLAVGGDSAGGNLAAVVSIAERDAGIAPPIAFQLLIYPATDMRCTAESHRVNGSGYLLTSDAIAYYVGHYLGDGDRLDPRASPLLCGDLRGLPPALVLTAGHDPLRDEGAQYADALTAAGVRTTCMCFARQIHGFALMGKVIDEADAAVRLCAGELKRALRA